MHLLRRSSDAYFCSRMGKPPCWVRISKEAAAHILHGKARLSPWHPAYAKRAPTPPRTLTEAAAARRWAEAAPSAGDPPPTSAGPRNGDAVGGESKLAGLALDPVWAPLGAGSPNPLAPVTL